jgi:DNA-binding CsgD family transcriptional regulator
MWRGLSAKVAKASPHLDSEDTAEAGVDMSEAEAISELIGTVYDAAIDPELWPGVLERACGFLSCCCGTLGFLNFTDGALNMDVNWGHDPDYTKLYLDHYVHLNPMIPATFRAPVGQVDTVVSAMPYDEFLKSRLFTEWGKPQGFIDAIQTTLEKSPAAITAVTFLRHESVGRADATAIRRMGLLVPHFQRAVVIARTISLQRVEFAAFADVVDALSVAVFLLGRNGLITFANPPAEAMLADGEVLAWDEGMLAAADARAGRLISDALAAVDGAVAVNGSAGVGIGLVGKQGKLYAAHLLPLTSGKRRQAGSAYAAVAALFVRPASANLPPPAEMVARLFRLTPTELRVLEAVVNIGGVRSVASGLGMSEATVKTHLQNLFDKTGVRSQADLIRLVAGFASPLA